MKNKFFMFIVGCFVLFTNNAKAFNTELYSGIGVSKSVLEYDVNKNNKSNSVLELKAGFRVNVTKVIFFGGEVYYNFNHKCYINTYNYNNDSILKFVNNRDGARVLFGFNMNDKLSLYASFGEGTAKYMGGGTSVVSTDSIDLAGFGIIYKLRKNLELNLDYERQSLFTVKTAEHVYGNKDIDVSINQVKVGLVYNFE